MNYAFNRRVQQDVNVAMRYYRDESGDKLADEFFDELMHFITKAAGAPMFFHVDTSGSGLRRANLKRFPYHFLYRVRPDGMIYILVVRHHQRHPRFGLRRK